MSEWWTYGLSDFLLFSSRTYYRLIERHNVGVWPAQLVTIGLGLGILWLLRRPAPARTRAISAVLAILWAWVGWMFVWRRYAGINWAAGYFVWLFVVEVALLTWIGVVRGRLAFRVGRDVIGVLGLGLAVVSVLIYPLLARLVGRDWGEAEIFGIAPDPTVVATLGLLLLATGRARWALLVAPILLCGVSAATLWAMGSPETWILLGALAATGIALRRGSSSRARPGTAGVPAGAGRETSL
ncbi:MAG: DUF6064 family protein [Gemmatimonadales bacterium]